MCCVYARNARCVGLYSARKASVVSLYALNVHVCAKCELGLFVRAKKTVVCFYSALVSFCVCALRQSVPCVCVFVCAKARWGVACAFVREYARNVRCVRLYARKGPYGTREEKMTITYTKHRPLLDVRPTRKEGLAGHELSTGPLVPVPANTYL